MVVVVQAWGIVCAGVDWMLVVVIASEEVENIYFDECVLHYTRCSWPCKCT
jgi:hypothetical protein